MSQETYVGGLLEEIENDDPRKGRCRVCDWLATRPEEEQAEWAQALEQRRYKTKAIHRAMLRRGSTVGYSTLERHRGGHGQ